MRHFTVRNRTLFRLNFDAVSKISGSIVVVDDDPDVLLSARLYLEQFFENVVGLSKPMDLLPTVIEHQAEVVLLDLNYHRGRNDGGEGLELLKRLRTEVPGTKAVVMTAYAEVELAVEAIKAGALDFVSKPWSNEKLLATMMAAMELSKSKRELDALKRHQSAWQNLDQELPEMIGNSDAMQAIQATIRQVAPTDANVLILGENGTGKEIVAQWLHHYSQRSDKPFVKVDLGSIHENLFESELFGARKGAYTDLKQDRVGRFEMAERGTLFLDEIANLTLPLQAKLLSVLQNREFFPVGASQALKMNVRFVSATNADLRELLETRAFRQDLMYRVNTIEIVVPPLRDRLEDLPLLTAYFLQRFGAKYRKELRLAAGAMQQLQNYSWPGNIRELEHAMERAVIMAKGNTLTANDINAKPAQRTRKELPSKLSELEQWHIEKTIAAHQGNISQAAKSLGLTRAALYRRMEKYGL